MADGADDAERAESEEDAAGGASARRGEQSPGRRARGRPAPERALQLFALCGFVVAQPLLDVLGRDATFFVAHGSQPLDLLLLCAFLLVCVPLPSIIVSVLATRAGTRLGAGVHLVLVWLLLASGLLPLLGRQVALGGGPRLLAAAGLASLLACVVYARSPALRRFFTLLAAAPLLFGLVFLFYSDASKLLGSAQVSPPPQQRESSLPTVVLLVADELPLGSLMDSRGEIDARLFPNFAALAAQGSWFRNASASHSHTDKAIPALLTGRWPSAERGLPILAEHPDNLCSLLARSHRVVAVEAITQLCPPDAATAMAPPPLAARMRSLLSDAGVVYAHIVVPQAWRDQLPAISGSWRDFGALGAEVARPEPPDLAFGVPRQALDNFDEDRAQRFRRFIARIEPGEQPGFYFHHTLLTHRPWRELPSGGRYLGSNMMKDVWSSELDAALGFQRHLLALGELDRLLGELLEALRKTGRYDDALVIVTSDHGISFRSGHSKRFPDAVNLPDILYVPLLIKRPGQRAAARSERNVEAIDILPTVIEALGLEPGWRLDGASVFGPQASERAEKVLYSERAGEVWRVDGGPPSDWKELALRRRQLPDPAGWDDVFALGPRPDLVGRRAETLATAAPHGCTLQVWGWPADAEAGPARVPGYLSGRIRCEPGEPRPRLLAVSVAGVIRAVVQLGAYFELGRNEEGFAVVLDDAPIASGGAGLALYALEEGDRLAQLSAQLETEVCPSCDFRLGAALKALERHRAKRGQEHETH